MIERILVSGVKAVSICLDGAVAQTHETVRGIPGHFEKTVEAIRALTAAGLTVQINTTVMRSNVDELAEIADIVASTGAHIWEVFFLVQMGRGVATEAVCRAGARRHLPFPIRRIAVRFHHSYC